MPANPSRSVMLPPKPINEWYPKNISPEELIAAEKAEASIQKVLADIETDKAYLKEMRRYLRYQIQPLVRKARSAILRGHQRIAGRNRQLKHMRKVLKKRLAMQRIQAIRKELNLK